MGLQLTKFDKEIAKYGNDKLLNIDSSSSSHILFPSLKPMTIIRHQSNL